MKTNKNHAENKDWQGADPRVLGQILAAQNIDFVLPDISHIAEFFAETLNTIPGISSCRVCLHGIIAQKGEVDSEICEECKASRMKAAGQEDVSPFLPGFDFKCELGEQPGMHLNAVASIQHHFGFFTFRVSDPDVFNVYKPFIGNLANYVALSLENRLQRELLQKSQTELEHKVEERTRELETANVQLQEEIETKRQGEEALQREQTLLSRIMETSPVGITLVDREGQITFANSQAEKVLGLTRDEITQRTYNAPEWHITTYDGAPFPDEDMPFQQVMSTRQPVHDIQHMIAWPDGRRLALSINGVPILNATGDVDSVVFTIENITERIHTESALRESEQKFRSFVEESSDGFTLLDEQGYIIEWNRARERMTGLKADQVIGRFIWDVMHQLMPLERQTPETYERNKKVILNALETGQSPIFNRALDAEVMTQDGERQFHQQTVFPIKTDKGYRIGSITRDITERKQAQEALALFRSLIDHANDIIEVADPETGRYLDVNEQACLTHDYTRDEYLALTVPQINTGMASRSWKETVEELRRSDSFVRESQHRRKDGSIFPVEININYVRLDRDYILSVVRDITERKKAEQALRESEERLRQIASSLREVIWLRNAQTRQVLYVNPAFEELTGRTCKSFYENRDIVIDAIHPDDKEGVIKALEQRLEGVPYDKEHRIIHLDGSVRWVLSRIFPVRNEAGEVYRWASIMEDISERKQAEEELKNAHEQLERSLMFNEALLSAIPTPVFYKDKEGRYLGCNQAFAEFTGVSSDQIKGKTVMELWPSENAEVYHKRDLALMHNPEQQIYEFRVRDKDGVDHPVIFAKNVFRDENQQVVGIVGAFLDITERKRAEQEHLAHLRFFEGMDQINRALQGSNDLEQRMSDVLDAMLSIFQCDRAWLVYPCDPDSPTWQIFMERTRAKYPSVFPLGVDLPLDPSGAESFRILRAADGPVKFGPGSGHPVPVEMAQGIQVQSFIAMAVYPKVGKPWSFGMHQCSSPREWTRDDERLVREIGQRLSDALTSLLTYRNLEESEQRYHQLVDISPDAIVSYGQGGIVFVNPAAVRLAGAKSAENLIGRSVLEFIQPDYSENVNKEIEHILKTGETGLFVRENILRVDGTKFDVEVAIVPYQFQGEDYIQILARDITERKQHEREREAIITVSTALRQATTRTEIINVFLDQLVDLFKAHGAVLVLPDPKTGGFIDEMGRGVVGERMIGLNIPPGKGVCNWVIKNRKPYLNNQADRDALFYRPDLLGNSRCLISVPLIAHKQALGALWVARPVDFVEQDLRLLNAIADIAANAIHRVMLHEQTELQLRHLTALHQIDLAISANYDLNVTLAVILNNVKNELEVDAVSILLLNPVTHTLDYAAGIGFRTRNIEQSHVRLGNGCAGRAAQEVQTVFCSDLRQNRETFSRASFLADEEFVSHYDTPLVVKGQVKGVLETFHRAVIEPEPGWLSYFEILATQAAIAIENASLFENLQQSNMELTLAYDATIEGWSRALDLRDRETEGHTQRVAEMALELAEKIGMSDAEKMDLRRGALLHDIGKMGIPDAILLKPGRLSESEWKIMRQHPVYAYQMLSPITYLKHALEVPYYHHEKWDGSGYPRGLKGDGIPLSARVFAVVDVFDALTSDRPYSKAWPPEEAYRYIREQAGKHFDPQIVKIFLENK
jgi:PAS domain S-box-containing protein/putative nucleotidyltransferase with HDIG domain